MNKPLNDLTFKKSITFNILSKFVLSIIGYFLGLWILFFLCKAIFSSFIWQGDEFLYGILKAMQRNSIEIIFLSFILGFFVLLAYYWNKTLGFLKMVISATENMYSEQTELIRLPPELKEIENRMNEIKANMERNRYAAKEAEQRKNDLIIYLAHDLKTPLTSVIGYLTLLNEERKISDELRNKYVSISLNKAERLEDLINEFFEITRFNLCHTVLEKEKVNLTRMLEQITYEFMPMFLEKNLTYTLKVEPDVLLVCDVDKMQRVFDNLLRNAVNYSFEDSNIEILLKQENDMIQINFINQGNTIPKEKLERMFEQFYRLDSSRSTKSGGAGLGLAIAKEIIEFHGGEITAKSKNETISFEIIIPSS